MPLRPIEPGTEWTARAGKCGECGKPEHGYAKKDSKGVWHPSCWPCIKITPVKVKK